MKKIGFAITLIGTLAMSVFGQTTSAIVNQTAAVITAPSTASVTTTPVPNAHVTSAMTQLYRVGAGDVLDIQLLDISGNQSTLFTVMEDGSVDYPFAGGPLAVVGFTPDEVAALLKRRIKVFNSPNVTVTVRDYSSHNVTVNGFVKAPGVKALRREAVPLYVVISEAMPLADATRATIIRQGRGPLTLKLADARASETLVIAGDVIKISAEAAELEFFFAGGAINSPGQKSFHSGLTLMQAIMASGGVTENSTPFVRVSRQNQDGRLVNMQYNLADIESGKIADPLLNTEDRIEVKIAL